MAEHVWLNGTLVSADEAHVGVFDAAFLHGAGLFETMRAYAGKVFRLEAHLARLERSAEALGINPGIDRSDLRDAVSSVLKANSLTEARVRLTVTAGPVRADDESGDRPHSTVLITAAALEACPERNRRKGMTVLISPFVQSRFDPLCGHKCTSYFARLLALRQAQQNRCDEAIWFTTDKLLAEGCITSVFLVKADVLKTPPLDTPVLPGITRQVVIELAQSRGITVQQAPLTINDLLDADEVFVTNSVIEIVPVCRVERHAIGDEKPGKLTRLMAEAYRQQVAQECGPDG